MGIAPYNTFTFDGVASSTYGVYLTGEGVFNAPERSVEMLSIPGRNGNYALDLGKFENISVTYKVGMYDVDESNFATKVSNFRNWLCSKVGYVRLTDTYNTGEYRMAVYKSGLELDHELLIAGEAEITFDCKPQRWLTSGETKSTLTSGNAITNPTLFPSSPQLQVYGYGDISLGGQDITVQNVVIGNIVVSTGASGKGKANTISTTDYFNHESANSGDTITVESVSCNESRSFKASQKVTGTITASATGNGEVVVQQGDSINLTLTLSNLTFSYGTSSSESTTATCNFTAAGGSRTGTVTLSVSYDGGHHLTYQAVASFPAGLTTSSHVLTVTGGTVFLDSTKSALGSPMYIDLDIGEAYKIENNNVVSVNDSVIIPAELPTLPSGNTTITFDNTFTKVDIVPRWWRV